jgi:hypothetical protein
MERQGAHPAQRSEVANSGPFGSFCDLIGQAMSQKDPAVRDEQIAEAERRLLPLRVALDAAEAILEDVRKEPEAEDAAEVVIEQPKQKRGRKGKE